MSLRPQNVSQRGPSQEAETRTRRYVTPCRVQPLSQWDPASSAFVLQCIIIDRRLLTFARKRRRENTLLWLHPGLVASRLLALRRHSGCLGQRRSLSRKKTCLERRSSRD